MSVLESFAQFKTELVLPLFLLPFPIFPHQIRTLTVRSRLDDFIRNDWLNYRGNFVAATPRKDSKGVLVGAKVLHEIGTIVTLGLHQRLAGTAELLEIPRDKVAKLDKIDFVSLTGLSRVKIVGVSAEGYRLFLRVRPVESRDSLGFKPSPQNLIEKLKAQFQTYCQLSQIDPPEIKFIEGIATDDYGYFCDAFAAFLANKRLTADQAQQILATLEPDLRVRAVINILEAEIDRLKTYTDPGPRPFSADKDDQDEGSLINLEDLTDEVKERIKEAESQLKQPDLHSADRESLRHWLKWVKKLPWHQRTRDIDDIKQVKQRLDRNHYDLEKAKNRIVEYLAVKMLAKEKAKSSVLCLVGPPGVGKTSLARSVAQALNRKFFIISLGALTTPVDLGGSLRVWVGAEPGSIIKSLARVGSKNPIILLDEIDKAQSIPNWHGSVSNFLLSLLDPELNKEFIDAYLDIPFDVSEALFITTANTLAGVAPVLTDRLEIVQITSYSSEDKLHIVKDYIYPKQVVANGLEGTEVTIKEEVFKKLVYSYRYRRGIRSLERAVEEICRKIAREVVEKKTQKFLVTAANISDYLTGGLEERKVSSGEPTIGSVLSLVNADYGGEVSALEAVALPGKGSIQVTGLAEQTVEESARVAYSYLKSHLDSFGLPRQVDLSQLDLHVHFSDLTTFKEGPSAGLAIFLAMLSAVSGTPVDQNIAVTGEINLKGDVLPVGAVSEKLQAAKNAGVVRAIIPKQNQDEAVTFLKQEQGQLELFVVATIQQALPLAFQPTQANLSGPDNSWGNLTQALVT